MWTLLASGVCLWSGLPGYACLPSSEGVITPGPSVPALRRASSATMAVRVDARDVLSMYLSIVLIEPDE